MSPATKKMSSEKSYAAIVLYYRAGNKIWDTVRLLQHQSLPPEEIIIVDNGSKDGVCNQAPNDVTARIITLDSNVGYTGGMHVGYRQIRSECAWVALVTHEVRLDSECMRELVMFASRSTTVTQVGPAVFSTTSDQPWSLGGSFTPLGNTTHKPGLESEADGPQKAKWLEGCCNLIRRDAIDTDFWNERYFLYWDDVDMSTRLSKKGEIFCLPAAKCWQETSGQMTYFSVRNRILFWKNRKQSIYVATTIAETMVRALRDIWRSDQSQAVSRLRGVADGLSGRLSRQDWENRTI